MIALICIFLNYDLFITRKCIIIINLQADFTPSHVIVDYEAAAIGALEEVFPTATISGCLFHFSQAILRKVSKLGLRTRYLQDEEFRMTVRSLIAMAFIPVSDVRAR